MIRLALYLLPVLINYVLGGVFFITALRCSQANAPGWVVGATLSCWSLIYSVTTALIKSKITLKNCAFLIILAGLMLSFASIGFLVFPGIYIQFVWIAVNGLAAAFSTTAFQLFAKAVEPDQNTGVVKAAALYTASWSLGMATGPFLFGLFSATANFIINAVLGVVISLTIYGINKVKKVSEESVNTPDAAESDAAAEGSSIPDMAIAGWTLGIAGTIAVAILRCMIPYRSTQLGFSDAAAGTTMAVISYTQVVMGLLLLRAKKLMYAPVPTLLFGALGFSALLAWGFGSSVSLFLASGVIFGIYSGFFYFMFVYHALISKEHSARNVAVNEIIVGTTGTFAPFLGGLLSSPETSGAAFPVAAVLCITSVILTAVYFIRKKYSFSGI